MKTVARILVPLVALASLAGLTLGVLDLMETGTCASGGPYVSARECPDGTGTTILLVSGCAAIYILVTIAASFSNLGAAAFWFGLLFTVLGTGFLYAEIAGTTNGSGGVGYIIGPIFVLMGILPMLGGAKSMIDDIGAPDDPVAPAAARWMRPATGQAPGGFGIATGAPVHPGDATPTGYTPVAVGAGMKPADAPATAPAAPAPKAQTSALDFVNQVKELDELRSKGALTQAEFEAAKKKILEGS